MKKVNKVGHKFTRRTAAALALAFVAVVAVVAVYIAYERLCDVWYAPCAVVDIAAQVDVNDGDMVKGAAVLDAFGIRTGTNATNLARVDWGAKRAEVLKKFPCIRSIDVTRHLPDRVTIRVTERTPFVKLATVGSKTVTGRVADRDGVVFKCLRGTTTLPTIREARTAVTPVGATLDGRSRAALRLFEASAEAKYMPLGILEVSTTKRDFLVAVLGNYAQAKIAWEGMDDPSPVHLERLVRQLDHLLAAFQSVGGVAVKIWNVTESDHVFADTKEPLL